MVKRRSKGCDKFRSGICSVWIDRGELVYCPPSRGGVLAPGECCHHPLVEVRPMLAEIKRSGIKLARYGKKLRDPVFVKKLYSAFRKARSKRSAASRMR